VVPALQDHVDHARRPRQHLLRLPRVGNYPGDFLRHSNFVLHRQPDDGSALFNGGTNAWDSPTSWTDDVSWVVSPPWA
jgi:non-reducing end alpha-L-arabinofuranosidase